MVPNDQTTGGNVCLLGAKLRGYICDTQQIRLNNFRIRVFNQNGGTTSIYNSSGGARVIIELVFVEKDSNK